MLKFLPAAGYTPARAFVCLTLEVLLGCLAACCPTGEGALLLGAFSIAVLFVFSLAFGFTCLWPARTIFLVSMGLVLGFTCGAIRQSELKPGDGDLAFVKARYVKIRCSVQDLKERRHDNSSVFVMVVEPSRLLGPYSDELGGKTLVECTVSDSENFVRPHSGEEYEISGRLEIPREKQFSFQFDECAWLSRQGIFSRLACRSCDIKIVARHPESDLQCNSQPALVAASTTLETFRQSIVSTHNENLGLPLGSLLSSIVMGDRVVAVDAAVKKEFSQVGLAHLLAASGLNLTIIVAAALALSRMMRRRNDKWLSCLVSFFCVLSFTMLAGFGPSVNRAAVMCLTALWARLAFVKMNAGVALAAALLLAMLFDPLSVLDLGLELSYAATFGIVYIYPHLEGLLPAKAEGKLPHFRRGIQCLLLTVICAQLAVLPIQLGSFRQFSALTLPANLLAEPVIMPLTVIGFVSSLVAGFKSTIFAVPAGAVCSFLDALSYYPLLWLKTLAHCLAQLPAMIVLEPPGAVATMIYYSVLSLALLSGRRPVVAAVVPLACSYLIFASVLRSPVLEIYFDRHGAVANCANRYFVCCGGRMEGSYVGFLRRLGLGPGSCSGSPDLECDGIKMRLLYVNKNLVGIDLSRGAELVSVSQAGPHCRLEGRVGLELKLGGLVLNLPLQSCLENGRNASLLKLSLWR